MCKKFTVEIYDQDRIDWCKANPSMLTKRQRQQARELPQTHGALPSQIHVRYDKAEVDGLKRIYPPRLIRVVETQPVGRPREIAGEPAESQIQLRVQRSRKAAYVRAANRANRTLAGWCFEHLDKASGYQPR